MPRCNRIELLKDFFMLYNDITFKVGWGFEWPSTRRSNTNYQVFVALFESIKNQHPTDSHYFYFTSFKQIQAIGAQEKRCNDGRIPGGPLRSYTLHTEYHDEYFRNRSQTWVWCEEHRRPPLTSLDRWNALNLGSELSGDRPNMAWYFGLRWKIPFGPRLPCGLRIPSGWFPSLSLRQL